MSQAPNIDGVLITWGDRLFYPGNRVVKVKPQPRLGGDAARLHAAAIRQRIEATVVRRAPQVIVKVTGGGRGMKAIAAHFRYISRNGRLEIEDQRGETMRGKDSLHDLADEWRLGGSRIPDDAEPGHRREAYNIMLSMPRGTDPLAVQRAAREFAQAELADHKYVMVLHDHQANPHVHISVRAESRLGKRLNPRKADLHRWRETFAEMAPLVAAGEPGRIDIDALAELFAFGWYLGDRSCVADLSLVWQHDVAISAKGIELHRKLSRLAPAPERPDAPQLRNAIRESVARSIQGAGPLGLALSGGLDSSILAWELNSLDVQDLTCITVQTADGDDAIGSLSDLGFPRGEAWESWKHVVVRVDDGGFLSAFEESVLRFGQPTTMSSLPLYQRLADCASTAGVRALLLGEGVDEYFAGYASYGKVAKLATPFDYYRHPTRERLVSTLFGAERLASVQERFRQRYGVDDLRAVEAQIRLTRLLLRSDVCLMSRSIEGRVPFLYNGIPSLAMATPWHELVAAPGKALLREAYAQRLGSRATRGKVRFKSSDAMLLRCLDLQQLEQRIVAACSPLFGQAAMQQALAALRSADGFDADILCLLMSLTFLIEGGLLHDDTAIPTSACALHA